MFRAESQEDAFNNGYCSFYDSNEVWNLVLVQETWWDYAQVYKEHCIMQPDSYVTSKETLEGYGIL